MLACIGMSPAGLEAFPCPDVIPLLYMGYGCSNGRDSLSVAGAAGRSAKTALSSGSGEVGKPS